MATKDKIYITIILALAVSFFSYNRQPVEDCLESPASIPDRYAYTPNLHGKDTTLAYLQERYDIFNDAYFDNKLPRDVKIDFSETDTNFMGSTSCTKSNVNCTIRFNRKYNLGPRYADLTLLHEMCHIPTFDERVQGATGQAALHGPEWRFCMLKLDITGANRYILIDGYDPDEKRLAVFK